MSLYSFFNLGARWRVGGQRHAPAALPLGNRLGTHRIRGWVDPRVGLDCCGKCRSPPEFDPRTMLLADCPGFEFRQWYGFVFVAKSPTVIRGSLSPRHGAPSGCGWRNGLQKWRVTANMLNKQLRTADNGWSSSLEVGRGANNSP